MKLEITGRSVTVDVAKLAQGVYDLHESKGSLAILKYGMLDDQIMKLLKLNLDSQVKEEFGEFISSLFTKRIDNFLKKVNLDIAVKVYGIANGKGVMVV